jgi:hypothetical protein
MVHDTWRPSVERRAQLGEDWLDHLLPSSPTPVELVRGSDGKVFVVEDGTRRSVRSGILAAALEQALGRCRDEAVGELDALPDGVPVELLEGDDGQAFLIIGGALRPARGIPLTHPIDSRRVGEVTRGAEIDVAAANVARRRLAEAMSGRFQVERLRSALKRKGVVGTAKAAWRRGTGAFTTQPDR